MNKVDELYLEIALKLARNAPPNKKNNVILLAEWLVAMGADPPVAVLAARAELCRPNFKKIQEKSNDRSEDDKFF